MNKIIPILAVGVALMLGGCGRDPGPAGSRAKPARRGRPVRRVRKAFRAFPARRDRRVHRDLKVRRARPAPRVTGDAAPVSFRAVQADGAISCEATETLVSVVCPSGGAPDGTKCTTTPTVGLCLKK